MQIKKYEKIGNNKYKIYLDNDTLTLYDDIILKNDLLLKKEIDNDLYNKLIQDNQYFDIYNMCYKYIMIRLRSVKEIREYLTRKKIDEDIINITINKLIDNKLLNEEEFTKSFIHDKLMFSTMGEYKIVNELKKYGIDNDIITTYINNIDKEIFIDKINKYINKCLKVKKNTNNLKNKIYNYLVNLGYDKSMIIEELNKYNF